MIEQAIKIAKRSSTGKYAMGCVLYDEYDMQTLSNGWSHIPQMKKWKLYSLHAELHAIARGRNVELNYAVAYIAAVSRKSGRLTIARPCRDCVIALVSVGVRRVVYTVPSTEDSPRVQTEVISDYIERLDDFKTYNSPQY